MKNNLSKKNIPNGWKIEQFEDCVIVPAKLKGLKNSEYKEFGKYPIFDQAKEYISGYSDEKELLSERYPAILFGDHTRIIKYINSPFIPGADGTKVFWSKDGIDSSFLYYSLLNLNIPNTGYNRHFKLLKDSKLLIPENIKEQKKIAEILSKVDEEINKTDELISKTEKIKSGLMNELFTKGIGHKKFKKTKLGEIPEDWEILTIKDSQIKIIDGDRGINYPKLSDFFSSEYCLFLNNKNIKDDHFNFSDVQFINQEKDNALSKGKLERGDVILTTRGTVGNVAFYNKSIVFENIRINSGMVILRTYKELNQEYLYYLMKSPYMKKEYKKITSGSAQPQLPIKNLERIYVLIPPKDEQLKIIEISKFFDQKLNKQKELKEKITKLKKGLMSDLLSGKVRVN